MPWNIKYSELFTVSVEQPFYVNRVCGNYTLEPRLDFSIIPTPECEAIMTRFDFLFKRTDNQGGIIVLSRTKGLSGINELLQFKPGKGKVLTFLLFLQNFSLINFNEIPSLHNEQIYYFSNQNITPAALRDHLPITKDSEGVKVQDVIKKTAAMYNFQKPSPMTPGTVKVKHLLSGKELPPKTFITEGGKTTVMFDLSSLFPGKCQMLESGITLEEFYYAGNFHLNSRVFGVIDISLDATLPANYRVIESDGSLTPQRPAYKIRMINRETLWRYSLHLEHNSPLYLEIESLNPADKTDFINRLNVVTNDPSITFNNTMIDDTRFEFLADNPIHLQEKYFSSTGSGTDTLQLSLKKYIGDVKEEPVRSSLPYPSTGTVDSTNAPLIYSDILITL